MSQTFAVGGRKMKQNLRIAILEDSTKLAESLRNAIRNSLVAYIQLFFSGEDLLKELASGRRFDIYILDYQLDRYHRKLWGDEVAEKILAFSPKAKIIGVSSASYEEIFTQIGAHFLVKASVNKNILRTIRELLSQKSGKK